MPRLPTLTYDRGTLLLHPPPRGKAWVDHAEWDDRVERFRIPADRYRPLIDALAAEGTAVEDQRPRVHRTALPVCVRRPRAAPLTRPRRIAAWETAGRRGVVVLPTGAGKTFVAQLAMHSAGRSTLVVVPTLDLLHQWYAGLRAAFPGVEVGLLGGGSRDHDAPLLVATYVSAAAEAERLGNRFALLVFDEVHHLPAAFTRVIAQYSIAPYRLGLTATPERSDGRDRDLFRSSAPRSTAARPTNWPAARSRPSTKSTCACRSPPTNARATPPPSRGATPSSNRAASASVPCKAGAISCGRAPVRRRAARR